MDQRLYDAARTGDVVALHAFLKEDPMMLDKICLAEFAETPLHVAALAGKTEFAKEIIRLMPSFAMELNKDGFAPMHLASARGHVEMVMEFLKQDNDYSLCFQKDKSGQIPLHHAVARGRIPVIKRLISHCCESLQRVTLSGETVLHLAVKNFQIEVLKVVLERLKELECFEMLLTTKDNKGKGKTIVELAQATKQLQVLELLKEYQNASTENEASITSPGNHEIEELAADEQAGQHQIDIPGDPKTDDQQASKGKKKPSRIELHNLLLVAAVLIATATYQAVLTPPPSTLLEDGYLNTTCSDSPEKNDCLEQEKNFLSMMSYCFIIINTAGFLSSVFLILIVTLPYRYIPLQLLAISISLLMTNYTILLTSYWSFSELVLALVIIGLIFSAFYIVRKHMGKCKYTIFKCKTQSPR